MKVIICPGVHKTQLTDRFLNSILTIEQLGSPNSVVSDWLVFPTDIYPAYSAFHLYQWLNKSQVLADELLFICFSAGVVSGMGTAIFLQLKGVKIKGLIAIDGWGVPLFPLFPLYRFSHDYFTHWSSALLGAGKESFYCEPAVSHLIVWEYPENCRGWIVKSVRNNREISQVKSSVRDYIRQIILS